ncbi:MAG: endonuclease [Bacteroidia bacterium]|nr:endonuclease [Bacteroidia bacterium]MCZ2247398.1 endonuclease [Bacteroidia bacterium]
MKKLFFGLLLVSIWSLNTQAQVAIPMPNFGFSDATGSYPYCAIPNGFTANVTTGNEIYNAANSGGANFPSLKLQSTGQYAMIHTATEPGPITYSIRGNIGNVSAWSGTFDVQQSVDGINFTALPLIKSYSGSGALPATGNYVVETLNPDPSARYIRWYFTSKTSSCNVGLDDISIAAPAIGPGPQLVVNYNSTNLVNNQTINFNTGVGNPITISLAISNYGNTNDLIIYDSTAISGTYASDYSITSSLPITVAASSNGTSVQNLDISFNPQANGSRPATLSIYSNDSTAGVFVVQLDGIGGTIASEPNVTLSNLEFTGGNNYIKSYRLHGSFTSSGSADGYLVVRQVNNTPFTYPMDGKVYLRGDTVGTNNKVVGSFTSTDFIVNNIVASTDYSFAIYAYNGNGTFRNYNQAAELVGNVTSSASMMPMNEYATINTSSSTFVNDLTSVINVPGRNKIYYGNYGSTMMKLFAATDTLNGKKVATCVYSGLKYIYSEPITWGYMSREHTYCHNWMPTFPADGSGATPNNTERPEYNDQHNLYPTNQDDVNAVRSNYPMGEVVNVEETFLDCKIGTDVNGNRVFEPRDEQKGRAARAIMYMAVAHNNLNDAFGNPQNWKLRNPISNSILYGQDQNVLKKWHYNFPPNNWDIARNDFLDSLQGNRNPFVDHPEYACYIDFYTMNYIANPVIPCNTLGVSNISTSVSNLYISPNPTSQNINLYFNSSIKEKASYQVFDITGKLVLTGNTQILEGSNIVSINIENLQSGIYQVKLSSASVLFTQKLVKE